MVAILDMGKEPFLTIMNLYITLMPTTKGRFNQTLFGKCCLKNFKMAAAAVLDIEMGGF